MHIQIEGARNSCHERQMNYLALI